MKRIGMGLLLALVCSVSFAQGVIPEVDTAEVLRRGDLVVVAGEGPRGGDEEAFLSAMSPPADDSQKWFITVLTTKDCAFCDKLKSDFRKAQELLAFVAAPDETKAWAHYNEYSAQDATQAWRVKEFKVASFPTVVIQPPRNGMWGDPKVVVFQQSGYDGNAKKLADSIRSTVKAFSVKMHDKGYPRLAIKSQSLVEGGSRQVAVDPPFVQPPQVDPFNPQYQPVTPVTPSVPSQWPPPATPVTPTTPTTPSLPSGIFNLTNLLLAVLVGLRVYERFIAPMTPTKADDLIVPIVLGFLERLTNNPTPNPPNPTPPVNVTR